MSVYTDRFDALRAAHTAPRGDDAPTVVSTFAGAEDLALDPVHPVPQTQQPVLREDLDDPGFIAVPRGRITTLAPLVPPGKDGADVFHARGIRKNLYYNLQRAAGTITKSMARTHPPLVQP